MTMAERCSPPRRRPSARSTATRCPSPAAPRSRPRATRTRSPCTGTCSTARARRSRTRCWSSGRTAPDGSRTGAPGSMRRDPVDRRVRGPQRRRLHRLRPGRHGRRRALRAPHPAAGHGGLPYVSVCVFARGLPHHLFTRAYLPARRPRRPAAGLALARAGAPRCSRAEGATAHVPFRHPPSGRRRDGLPGVPGLTPDVAVGASADVGPAVPASGRATPVEAATGDRPSSRPCWTRRPHSPGRRPRSASPRRRPRPGHRRGPRGTLRRLRSGAARPGGGNPVIPLVADLTAAVAAERGAVRPPGRDQPGHHGHRRHAGRRPRRWSSSWRPARSRTGAGATRRGTPRHADAGPHPHPARRADHLRAEGGGLAAARPGRRGTGCPACAAAPPNSGARRARWRRSTALAGSPGTARHWSRRSPGNWASPEPALPWHTLRTPVADLGGRTRVHRRRPRQDRRGRARPLPHRDRGAAPRAAAAARPRCRTRQPRARHAHRRRRPPGPRSSPRCCSDRWPPRTNGPPAPGTPSGSPCVTCSGWPAAPPATPPASPAGSRCRPRGCCDNLGLTRGLVVSERLAAEIGGQAGPGRGQGRTAPTRSARRGGRHGFGEALAEEPALTALATRERLRELTDPGNYPGSAAALIDRALTREPGGTKERTSRS